MRNIKHKITEKYLFKSGHSGTVAFVTVKFDFAFFTALFLLSPCVKLLLQNPEISELRFVIFVPASLL